MIEIEYGENPDTYFRALTTKQLEQIKFFFVKNKDCSIWVLNSDVCIKKSYKNNSAIFQKKKNCWFIKKASLISFNLIQGFRYFQFNRNAPHNLRVREPEGIRKRCFDTVFGRPYRCFLITLKVILYLSDRYKLFTSDWIWIEVCQNAVFSKIDIFMTTINKKLYM